MKLKPVHAGANLVVLAALVLVISACSNDGRAKQATQPAVPVKIGDVMQQNVPVQI